MEGGVSWTYDLNNKMCQVKKLPFGRRGFVKNISSRFDWTFTEPFPTIEIIAVLGALIVFACLAFIIVKVSRYFLGLFFLHVTLCDTVTV